MDFKFMDKVIYAKCKAIYIGERKQDTLILFTPNAHYSWSIYSPEYFPPGILRNRISILGLKQGFYWVNKEDLTEDLDGL
jgi:hypothetical protein